MMCWLAFGFGALSIAGTVLFLVLLRGAFNMVDEGEKICPELEE